MFVWLLLVILQIDGKPQLCQSACPFLSLTLSPATYISFLLGWYLNYNKWKILGGSQLDLRLLPLLGLLIQSATALMFCPKMWFAERQNHCDWEHGDTTVYAQWTWQFPVVLDQICNISSGCNSNSAQVQLCDRWWPSSATCKNWSVQWQIWGASLYSITENTIIQLLTLCIKTLLKLPCKWHIVIG